MARIGEFIYPWGNGHYSRMSRLNNVLPEYVGDGDLEIHYSSKGNIYDKLAAALPDHPERVHEVLMPTPIDGRMGPDIARCLTNVLLPVSGNPPLVRQIASYLREERRLYDTHNFDLVINDGDMGSNVLARNRGIPSLFVTNQFRPRLWASRFYFYPGLEFVSRQIAKATHILVADSPPALYHVRVQPELHPGRLRQGIVRGALYRRWRASAQGGAHDLERMVEGADFGYWMRTGNKSTNDGTGQRYEEVFRDPHMGNERRLVSHARDDPSIDSVLGRDKRRYTIQEAYEKGVDWLQIDVGFLTEHQKETVLENCSYAVINGSHTVMGEILGGKGKPIIGMPIYDEHTNNLRWAEQRGLGMLARNANRVISGIRRIRDDTESFREALEEFGRNFVGDGGAQHGQDGRPSLGSKEIMGPPATHPRLACGSFDGRTDRKG